MIIQHRIARAKSLYINILNIKLYFIYIIICDAHMHITLYVDKNTLNDIKITYQ